MTQVPRAALVLGLAGLIPFVWGVAGLHSDTVARIGLSVLGPDPRLGGGGLVLSYGVVILSFMSGVLWGFATRATARVWLWYSLSVLPALWAQVFVGTLLDPGLAFLATGYLGLLALDWVFVVQGLAPAWWLRLRLLLTAGVLASLALAAT
jgi:Protein of unknown function (DUF3429)